MTDLSLLQCDDQPLLFDEDQLPVLPAVALAATKWEHNGRYTLNDEVLCDEIAERCVMGFSARSIARTLHVSRLTVRAVMQVLEDRGKLGPLKQRMSRKMGYAIDLCLDRSIEALEEDRVQVNVLPILAGVLFDKKSLLDGDPTARVAHQAAETVSLESFKSWLEELRRKRGAINVESSAQEAICEVSGEQMVNDTAGDTKSDGAIVQNAAADGGQADDPAGGGSLASGPSKSSMD